MKILNKPQILPCECLHCGTLFQPTHKHLFLADTVGRASYAKCPFCNEKNPVQFEKDGKRFMHYEFMSRCESEEPN